MAVIKKFDAECLQYMSIFGRATGITPKDYFEANSELVFIVDKDKVGAALGREGKNIRMLRERLNRNIKVMGAGGSASELAANFLYPLKARSITIEADTLNIDFAVHSERRILLNNQQSRLKLLKSVVKRYFPEILDIRVL